MIIFRYLEGNVIIMKKPILETLDSFLNTEINKIYDTETVLKKKHSSNPYASIHLKGEFAVTPLQIIMASAIIGGMCITASLVKRQKKK